MRIPIIICLSLLIFSQVIHCEEDDEFAEFDVIEEKDEQTQDKTWSDKKPQDASNAQQDDDGASQKMDSEEFDHFLDQEEFEGQDFDEKPEPVVQTGAKPDLKITKVPLHLRANWPSYYAEAFMIIVILVYFINYFSGRSKNMNFASGWLEAHKPILESNFALVGEDGQTEGQEVTLRKEAEHEFVLWCSGRQNVRGLLIDIKLLKRQCLLSTVMQMLKPGSDVIQMKFLLDALEPTVFCLATKKSSLVKPPRNHARLSKDLVDLAAFTSDRKSVPDKSLQYFGNNFVVHSESGETTNVFFSDPRIATWCHEYKDLIDYIHISDQYCSPAITEEQSKSTLQRPLTECVLLFGLALTGKGAQRSPESLSGILKLALYIVDKFSRFKLSKEAKAKADKKRQKVEEAFLKTTHQQRQELAQQRREDRIREEREKIMNEEDPDKQRKWELKEQKRNAKRSNPKMKQMKIRAM